MDNKYVIGFITGIFLVFLLGAGRTRHINSGCNPVHAGGVGTYQAQMSNDGKTIAVTDTRTGLTRISSISAGDEILSFSDEERFIENYRVRPQ